MADSAKDIFKEVTPITDIKISDIPDSNPQKNFLLSAAIVIALFFILFYIGYQYYYKKSPFCTPCRMYAPLPPNWCQDGKIILQGKDKCGCMIPSKCVR